MTTRRTGSTWRPLVLASLVVGLLAGFTVDVQANTPEWNIQHGRLWVSQCYDGADGWSVHMVYPAAQPTPGEYEYLLTRAWNYMSRKGGSYLMSTNFTDPNGATWTSAVSGMFRNMNYNYPSYYVDGTFDYVWPLGMVRDVRWTHPTVTVNDTLDIDFAGPIGDCDFYPSYGNDPRPDFTVVSDLVTERSGVYSWRYVQGVKLSKRMYSYPYGSAHQDYVIQDVTLTNDCVHGDIGALTGTKQRTDTTLSIPDQTATGVIWWQNTAVNSQLPQSLAGGLAGLDVDAMYVNPWPGYDNSAWIGWDIDYADYDGPDYGDPGGEDYGDLLLENCYRSLGTLFASTGPGANYDVNMTGQPAFRDIYYEKALDFGAGDYSPLDMDEQRSLAISGALQMPIDQSYRTYPITEAIKDNTAGPTMLAGSGPVAGELNDDNVLNHGWDIPKGESVRVVQVYAGGGIDQEEGRRIGQAWAAASAASAAPDSWMSAEDQALFMTGEDTVRKALNLAYWNFFGEFSSGVTDAMLTEWGIPNYVKSKPAGQDEAYNVPETPRPPSGIWVTAPTSGGIKVAWGTEAEADPDFDTGVADFVGYRVYRQAGSRFAPFDLVMTARDYDLLTDGDGHRFWIDGDTEPGVDYWYTVSAVDDGSQNWADAGVVQESGRWWMYTGMLPGTGVTPKAKITSAGAVNRPALAMLQNVPNPFNPTTSIAVTFDQDYSEASLRVYDVLGRQVRTLHEGSVTAGMHNFVWNGIDNSGRSVASGVYITKLVTPNGSRTIRMVLVR